MTIPGRNIVPLIHVPEPEDLGPAMQACTIGERAWVIAKIETGASNAECARLAGYSDTGESAKTMGYVMAHRQRVQEALLEQARKLLRNEGPKSVKLLATVRDNPRAEDKDRIKAAVELLNRAGMSAVTESHLTVTHELLTDAQKDQRILTLAAELGLSEDVARKMLIAPADMDKNAHIVEAEFEEVREPISPEERAALDHDNELRRQRDALTPQQMEARKERLRADKSEKAKAKYAEAQGQQIDLDEYLAGRDGLEDLLP
jgi:hypothetical protein